MKSPRSILLAISFVALAILTISFTNKGKVEPEPHLDTIDVQASPKLEVTQGKGTQIEPSYKIGTPELPAKLSFAGESVPLDRSDVKEKLDREMLVNTYWQSSTILLIKRSKRIFSVIEPILKAEGVPDDFKYLAVAESGLIENAISSAGARGVWQFMKTTGRKYGLESTGTVEERYNTKLATKAACQYLKKAYKETGSWALAAAAYNRGLGGIKGDLKKQAVSSYYDLFLNRETGRYVYRIIALKTILEDPSKYGFNISPNEYYSSPRTYSLQVDTGISSLPAFAADYGTTYNTLRTLNPWLISYRLENKSGKKYVIEVPYREAEEGIEQH